MDIKARIAQNEEKLRKIQSHVQQLQQEIPQLMGEILRLEGESRLLVELDKEQADKDAKQENCNLGKT